MNAVAANWQYRSLATSYPFMSHGFLLETHNKYLLFPLKSLFIYALPKDKLLVTVIMLEADLSQTPSAITKEFQFSQTEFKTYRASFQQTYNRRACHLHLLLLL